MQVVPTSPCRGVEDWDVPTGHCGEDIWDIAAGARVVPTNTVLSPASRDSAQCSIAASLQAQVCIQQSSTNVASKAEVRTGICGSVIRGPLTNVFHNRIVHTAQMLRMCCCRLAWPSTLPTGAPWHR